MPNYCYLLCCCFIRDGKAADGGNVPENILRQLEGVHQVVEILRESFGQLRETSDRKFRFSSYKLYSQP